MGKSQSECSYNVYSYICIFFSCYCSNLGIKFNYFTVLKKRKHYEEAFKRSALMTEYDRMAADACRTNFQVIEKVKKRKTSPVISFARRKH